MPSEISAPTPITPATACAEINDPKVLQICILSTALNKTLEEKRAAADLAQKRLEEIESRKELSEDQKQLAKDLRRVIADLKDSIGQYKDFIQLLMKRPPKKCYIVIFHC